MAEARQTLKIFISYARRDAGAFAEELLHGLEVAGFEAFLGRHDIAAAEDWEARLDGLIQSADTVVFVVSPAAVASERCAWEVKRAEALSKRVIPVVAIDVPEAQTPDGLKRLNYIFFTEGHSFTRALSGLAKALRIDVGWIREHTGLGDSRSGGASATTAACSCCAGRNLTGRVRGWRAGSPVRRSRRTCTVPLSLKASKRRAHCSSWSANGCGSKGGSNGASGLQCWWR